MPKSLACLIGPAPGDAPTLVLLHEGREVERGCVGELLARHPGAASLEDVYLRVAAGRVGKEAPLASA